MSEPKNPYTEQLMRCSSLQKFPLYEQGVKELRKTLMTAAGGSVARAEQIVNRIMESRDTCPTPRELRDLGGEIQRAQEATPTGCEACEGQPWVTITRRIMDPITKLPEDRMGSKRCECAKGFWFQQKDRENEGKRAAGQPV